ncbi:MAG: hypothetical protein ABI205_04045, partial [Gemmatimonadaceae bacterium]
MCDGAGAAYAFGQTVIDFESGCGAGSTTPPQLTEMGQAMSDEVRTLSTTPEEQGGLRVVL